MKKAISFIALIIITFVLVLGMNTNVQAAYEPTMTLNISVKYGQTEARTMLDMINKFRTGKDAWYWNEDNKTKTNCELGNLTYDYNLEKIAMQRAAEIALEYSHTRPNGEMCFSIYPEGYFAAGENIAAGNGPYSSAKAIFTAWQETNEKYDGQGHRRNMLSSNFKSVGIGHVYYNGFHYWVQEFGDENRNPTKVSANDKTVNASVNILEKRVKQIKVMGSANSIRVGKNEKVSLPKLTFYATALGAWPSSNCPVVIPYTWKIENTSYAKISNGKVVGVKNGKTKLVTYIYGNKVSIPVTVGHNPAQVTGLKASNQKTTSLKLNWKKAEGATGYKVYKYNTKTKKYQKIATTKSTSYTVKKLKAGTKYQFKVLAYRTVNKKEYTGKYSSVLATATKPSTPKISKLTTKSKKVTVNWKKVSGASGYDVYMAKSKKGKYTKIGNVNKGSTVKYTKSKLTKKKTYYFKIRTYKTVNGKKIYSSYSSAKSIRVK